MNVLSLFDGMSCGFKTSGETRLTREKKNVTCKKCRKTKEYKNNK